MSKNVESQLNTPIAALLCEDHQERIFLLEAEESFLFKDLDFQEDAIRIGNLIFPHVWFEQIVVCKEENLREIKRNLYVS